jgi:ribosomal protein L7/L12
MNMLWFVAGFVVLMVILAILVSWRDAAARRSGLLPPAGQETMADVHRLIQAGERIAAIRCYREIHRCSLVEAKQAVENLSPPQNPQ